MHSSEFYLCKHQSDQCVDTSRTFQGFPLPLSQPPILRLFWPFWLVVVSFPPPASFTWNHSAWLLFNIICERVIHTVARVVVRSLICWIALCSYSVYILGGEFVVWGYYEENPLSMMLAVGLSYKAFILLKYVPVLPTLLRIFYHKWVLDFVKCFFCIY